MSEENELTQEEAVEFRAEFAAELEAEESGTPIVEKEKKEVVEETVEKDAEKIDPWEGVNPELKAQFDSMSSRLESFAATEERLKQAESRIGGITNELHAAKQINKDNTVEKKEAPTEDEIKVASESLEKWKELKNDFPDWADAIEHRLSILKSEMTPGVSLETLTKEIAALKESFKDSTGSQIEKAILSFAHPDYEQTISSSEYATWLKSQSADVIEKTNSVTAADAISVLDQFESFKKESKSVKDIERQRKDRLTKSVVVEGGPTTPVKSEADMSDSEYRANIAKEVFADT